MKKLFITLIISTLSCIGFSMAAQNISENAIGLRIGDSDGLGTEVSYQRRLKENNRLEIDLGWRNSRNVDAFKLVGIYQWVKKLDGDFNWYYGIGGGIGAFDAGEFDGSFALVAGDIGVEYNFEFPLQLSLDFRPELGFNNDFNDGLDFDIALGVRYRF